MARIAVAGSSGFVGRAVVAAARTVGLQVIPITERISVSDLRSPTAAVADWIAQYPKRWANLVSSLDGVDVVVNAAGVALPDSDDVLRLWGGNVCFLALLAAAAAEAEVPRLVHVSSAAVQGRQDPLDESDRLAPFSVYSRSKAAAETFLVDGDIPCPPEVVIYRPTSVQGPDRTISRCLIRLARLPMHVVVGAGNRPLPLALIENVGCAIVHLATTPDPPPVALHPWEGMTTGSVLRAFGGVRPTLHISEHLVRFLLRSNALTEKLRLGAALRRFELLAFGQGQRAGSLTGSGFVPPVKFDGYAALAEMVSSRQMTRSDRVLHVSAVEYGARTLLVPQLAALQKCGLSITLACAPDNGVRFSPGLERFNVTNLPFSRRLRPITAFRAILSFVGLVRRLRPQMVHLHSPAAALIARLAPKVLLGRDVTIAHTVHGFPFQWEDLHTWRGRMLEAIERALSGRTDLLLFVSEEDFSQAGKRGFKGRLVHLGNGVDDVWFEIPPVHRGSDRLRLLYIGRLVREKGLLDLISAMSEVGNIELAIAGSQLESERDGVLSEIHRQIKEFGLTDRVSFLGHVEHRDLLHVMERSHALVLPSYREGLPLSILEAMAAARPCVTTDVRGCRELVTDGYSGIIVAPGEPQQLAGAFRRLATMPDDQLRDMGLAARDRAWHQYRHRHVVDRLLDAYRNLGIVPREVPDVIAFPAQSSTGRC